MGKIKEDLIRITLPEREPHNGRMFIDLCENVHIHFRELRIVFSLPEFFEFCSILRESEQDLRNYLAQNPDYDEKEYGTTIMVAGGKTRQKAPLRNSPQPHHPHYFANDFAIELQDESVTDEIHVHWRDYRLALNREHFHVIARAFRDAEAKLTEFETKHSYVRDPHKDRRLGPVQAELDKYAGADTGIRGVEQLPLAKVKSRYTDIAREWNHRDKPVTTLVENFQKGGGCFPILVSTEADGSHIVIDGHHRLCAATIAGRSTIPAVVAPISFAESAPLRKAESLLKAFDKAHGYRFETAGFGREWLVYKMNSFYRGHYARLLRKSRRSPLMKRIEASVGRALRSVGISRTGLAKVFGRR